MNFFTLQRRKKNPQDETDINAVCGYPPPTHTYFNKYTSTKWQHINLETTYPQSLLKSVTLSRWVKRTTRVGNAVHFDDAKSQDTSWVTKGKVTVDIQHLVDM